MKVAVEGPHGDPPNALCVGPVEQLRRVGGGENLGRVVVDADHRRDANHAVELGVAATRVERGQLELECLAGLDCKVAHLACGIRIPVVVHRHHVDNADVNAVGDCAAQDAESICSETGW